jgi:hypothetical protein
MLSIIIYGEFLHNLGDWQLLKKKELVKTYEMYLENRLASIKINVITLTGVLLIIIVIIIIIIFIIIIIIITTTTTTTTIINIIIIIIINNDILK